jgi:hypothetical protein
MLEKRKGLGLPENKKGNEAEASLPFLVMVGMVRKGINPHHPSYLHHHPQLLSKSVFY